MNKKNGKRIRVIATIICILIFVVGCSQQGAVEVSYPTKQIELVVPYSPGGGTDVVARVIAPALSKKFGQNVAVVNKTGGSGVPGIQYVLNSKPDGYTMLVEATSSLLQPAFAPDTPYKIEDMTDVSLISLNPLVVIVKADAKWQTLKDLVEDIKLNPDTITFGTMSPATQTTLGVGQLLMSENIDPKSVKRIDLGGGGAQVVASVAGGQVDFSISNLSEVISLVDGGKLRALAVSTSERVEQLPEVPTTIEAGYLGLNALGFIGIQGPKGLPEDIVNAWNEAVSEAINDPEVIKIIEQGGSIPKYLGPKEYTEFLSNMFNDAVSVAKQMGLRN